MGFYNPSAQGVATSIVIGSTVITGGSGSGYSLVDGGGVINEFPYGGATNAGAGTTTTLTASSFRQQTITGTLGQTFKLPDATTLIVGDAFYFNNNGSSGTLTVQNAGASTLTTVPISGYVKLTVISNGSANGTWDNHAWAPSNATWGSAALNISGSFVIQTNSATALTLDTSQNATFAGQIKTSVTAPLLSTDTTAGAGAGPTWELYRNITGAGSNLIGDLTFTGNSANGTKRTWATIQPAINTATDGAEYADLYTTLIANGAQRKMVKVAANGNGTIFGRSPNGNSVNFALAQGDADATIRMIATIDSGSNINFTTNALSAKFYANGDFGIGTATAIATSATAGFVNFPSCAGTPTGTPANTGAGIINCVYDTSANKIWFYNGSWRGVLVT